MRSILLRSTVISCLLLTAGQFGGVARADTLIWDPVDGNGGTIDDGGGIWTSTNSNLVWNDGSGNVSFDNGDDVYFTRPTGADLSQSIFVVIRDSTGPTSSVVQPGSIVFAGTGYVIQGLGSGNTIDTGSGNLKIDVVAGSLASIRSGISGNGGLIVNGGAVDVDGVTPLTSTGRLVLGSASTATGLIDVRNGTLQLSGLASVAGTLNVSTSGATLITETGSVVSGMITLNDGILTANGGTYSAGITQSGGSFRISNGQTLNALGSGVFRSGGDFNVFDGATLNANVSSSGGDALVRGTITGNVLYTNGETMTVSSVTTGGQTFTGTIQGLTTIGDGFSPDPVLNNATLVSSGGRFEGGIRLRSGGTVRILGGTVAGDSTTTGVTVIGGDLVIGSAGVLTGNVVQSGGSVTHDGTITSTVNMTGGDFTAFGAAVTSGVMTVNGSGATVTASGGEFRGGIALSSGTVNVNGATRLFDSTAPAPAPRRTLTQTGGSVNISSSGSLDGNLWLGGGTAENRGGISGNVSVNPGGTLNAAGGAFSNGVQNNGGTINISANTATSISNASGTLNVISGRTLAGTLNVTGGQVNVEGIRSGLVTVSGGTLVNSGTISGGVALSGGVTRNASGGSVSGLVTVSGTGQLDADGGVFGAGVDQTGGTFNVNQDTTLPSYTISGGTTEIDASRALTANAVSTGGTLAIRGTLSGSLSHATAGAVDLYSTGTVTGLATLDTGGTLNLCGGALSGGLAMNGGTLNYLANTTGNLAVTLGAVNIGNGVTLTGNVAQSGGTASNDGTITGTLNITGGTFTQLPGTVSGATSVNAAGVLNTQGGVFAAPVTVGTGGEMNIRTLASSGTINRTGGRVDLEAGGQWVGQINAGLGTGQIAGTLNGTLTQTAGDMSIVSGAVLMQTVLNGGGTLNVTGGSFNLGINNTAMLDFLSGTATGNVTTGTGGSTRILSGATLDGDLTSTAGTTIIRGIADGAVNVNGGTLTSYGTGQVTGITIVNPGGALNAEGGSFTGVIRNAGGSVNVNQSTTGSINNILGTTVIASGATLSGGLANGGGQTNVAGTISGALGVSGGQVNVTSGGSVGGLATVSGTGVLNAQGGSFFATGITVTGGTANIQGNSSSGLTTVAGGQLNIAGGRTLTGAVQVNSGTMSNSGTVAGTISVAGGTVANSGNVTQGLNQTGGTFNHNGGTLSGSSSVSGGTLVLNGGGLSSNPLSLSGAGAVQVTANTTVNVQQTGGTLTITAGNTLGGALAINGGQTNNNGTKNGAITVGGGVLINAGSVTGTLGVSAGTVRNGPAGSINGLVTVSGTGQLDANGGSFGAGVTQTGGSVNINQNTAMGSFAISGGTTNIAASRSLTANTAMTGGTLNILGTLNGTLDQHGGGVINSYLGGDVTGLTTLNNGATLNMRGGTFSGGLDMQDGTLNLFSDSTGDIVKGDGTVNVGDGLTLTGDITQTGGATDIDGTLAGNYSQQGGTGSNEGAITGTVEILDGAFTLSTNGVIQGQTTVGGTGVLNAAGGSFAVPVNVTGGEMNVTGTSNGTITRDGGHVEIVSGGQWNGAINAGNGTGLIAGTLNGVLTQTSGSTSVVAGATLTQHVRNSGGALNVTGGDFVAGITNTGTLNVNSGTMTGNVSNGATGVTNIRGTIDGGLAVLGGTVSNYSGDVLSVTSVSTGGTLNAEGGNFSGSVNNTGGTFNINKSMSGAVMADAGLTAIASGAVLTGPLFSDGGETQNSGTINGAVEVAGGQVDLLAGDVTGAITVTGAGVLNANGGDFSGGMQNNGGTIGVLRNSSGIITNTAGATTIAAGATLDGALDNRGGQSANAGTIAGNLIISDGTVTTAAGSQVGGNTTLSGSNAVLTANGGGFANGVAISAGTMRVAGAVTADVTKTAGTLAVLAGGQLNGALVQQGGASQIAGVLNGRADISGGTFNLNSGGQALGLVTALTGSVINANGGDFAGGVTIDGGTLNLNVDSSGMIENTNGTLRVAAGQTFTGTIANRDATSLDGTVDGQLDNYAALSLAGRVGTLNNHSGGAVDVVGTAATVTGVFTNFAGGDVTIDRGERLTTGRFVNNASNSLYNYGTLGGALQNNGRTVAQDSLFTGLVTNNSLVEASGTVRYDGGLINNGVIDLTGNAATSDRVIIGGAGLSVAQGASGFDGNAPNTFRMNLDLSDNGSSDRIVMERGAAVTGTVNLAFTTVNPGGVQEDDILILDVDDSLGSANRFTATASGLPVDTGGKIYYGLYQAQSGQSDVYIRDYLNPGIGGLAGNVTLTQSLIGSVINRPSSPFVPGLAYQDEDPCGPGVWVRAVGGHAEADGSSTSDGQRYDSTVKADYRGIQFGGDFACFNGYYKGWDVAAGAIGGINTGNAEQPVFAIDPATNTSTSLISSRTRADFDQYYGGVYLAAVRGALAADLQYRFEKTDFTLSNRGENGGVGLGIDDEDFSSKAQTLSGALSYAIPVKETNFTIIPTTGFAWTRTKTDRIDFSNGDWLQVEDFDTRTAFVGATVARTVVAESGLSLMNQFVTATYYRDFGDRPTSLFNYTEPGETRSTTQSIQTDNLRDYSEISAGISYTRILDPGKAIPAKQMSASMRFDKRFGGQLDSWGLTGQFRLQF